MRLEHLHLENIRSHELLDLDLNSVSCAAVLGRNGAGKSTLLTAIAWCLYGEGRADSLVRHGATTGSAEVVFRLGNSHYKVTRGRERGKRSWLHVEMRQISDQMDATVDTNMGTNGWQPSGHHTIAETEDFLLGELGMDYLAFASSVYAPQGEAGLLADMAPGNRKALLAELVGIDGYEDWRAEAAARARDATAHAATARADRERHQDKIAAATQGHENEDALAGDVEQTQEAIARCESDLERAAAREAAREQVERRRTLEREAAQVLEEAQRLVTAKQRAKELTEGLEDQVKLRETVERLRGALQREHSACQTWESEHRRLRERQEELHRLVLQGQQTTADAEAVVNRAKVSLEESRLKLQELAEAEGPVCHVCGQALQDDALALARRDLRRARDGQRGLLTTAEAALTVARETELGARNSHDEEVSVLNSHGSAPPAPDEAPLRDAERAVEQAVAREGELRAVQAQINVQEPYDMLKERYDALNEEASSLPEAVPEGPSIEDVRELERSMRERLAELQARQARAVALHEQIVEWQNELEAINDELREHERVAGVAEVLARAFSRDGIPALILDGVVQGVEEAANLLLNELGTSFRVRLATQVEKRSGKGMKETLEILIDTGLAEQPIEELSGGEKYRVAIALRLGLARALSDRVFECLLLDEPTDLDSEGMQTLAETLLSMPDRQIIVVSHDPSLADSLPQRIQITRRSDVSPSEVEVT